MFLWHLGPFLCAKFSVRKFSCAKELTFRRSACKFCLRHKTISLKLVQSSKLFQNNNIKCLKTPIYQNSMMLTTNLYCFTAESMFMDIEKHKIESILSAHSSQKFQMERGRSRLPKRSAKRKLVP